MKQIVEDIPAPKYSEIVINCDECNDVILVEECNVVFQSRKLHMRCLPKKRPAWIVYSCKHSLNCYDRPVGREVETARTNREDDNLVKA